MMRTPSFVPGVLVTAVALLAPAFAWSQTIATVNGRAVTKASVDQLIAAVVPAGETITPAIEKRAQTEAVTREILLQEAHRKGLENDPAFKTDMQQLHDAALIRSLMRDYQQQHPVTEAELAAGYEDFKKAVEGTQYHVRHIVVGSEDEAKAVVARLRGGAAFEQVAAELSKDTQTAKSGGDLGWVRPNLLVPDMREALLKLKKGEFTMAPVKTTFGYHIVKLDDAQEAQVPPLSSVKARLEQRLTEMKLAAYRQELVKAAKTDFKFSE